jgi:hypothetical protein
LAPYTLRFYNPLPLSGARRAPHGEFPAWYPYDGLGEPFVGMLIGSPFHPSKFLYLALPLGAAITVNILLCFPVAFLGTYILARRWAVEHVSALFAAVSYSFSGYMICITNNLAYLMAAATVPWALWASDRFAELPTTGRASVAAAIVLLVLLAGDPEAFVVTCALCAIVLWLRRGLEQSLLPAAALFTLTMLCGAVQILPSLHVMNEGKPATQELEAAEAWSVHPLRALDLALGPIFASESGDLVGAAIDRDLLKTRSNLWVNSIHVGLPAFVLTWIALAAFWRSRRTWLLAAVSLTLALLALGKYTPLYALAFHFVPGWRTFRYPEKLVPFCALGVALAAGAGLHAVQSDDKTRQRATVVFGLTAIACAMLAILELKVRFFSRLVAAPLWHGTPPHAALDRLGSRFLSCSAQSAIAAAVVSGVLRFASVPSLRGSLVVIIAFLALLAANGPLYEVVAPAVLQPGSFAAAIEHAEGPPELGRSRVYRLKGGYGTDYERDPELAVLDERAQYVRSQQEALDPVTPALWGLEGANAYLPGVSRRIADLSGDDREFASRYAPLFGVRYLSVTRDEADDVRGPDLQVVAENPALWLLLLRHSVPRPRAYLTKPRCLHTAAEAFRAMSSGRSLSPDESIVECTPRLAVPPSYIGSPGNTEIASYAPERVEIHANVDSPSLLVLNDAFYDGWSATVDGQPEAIVPVNYAVRGVPLAPGAHTVLFTYRTPGLAVGAWLTGIAISGVALLCVTKPCMRLRRGTSRPASGPCGVGGGCLMFGRYVNIGL